VWSVDTVVTVSIPSEGIQEPMWILEREFRMSDGDGSKTRLKLLPLGSLLLGDVPAG
jgi:prophage tail gpP-like protein